MLFIERKAKYNYITFNCLYYKQRNQFPQLIINIFTNELNNKTYL